MSQKYHRSLDRALDILELLSDTREGLSLSEICTTLSLPKSSVYSLVHTLSNRKYLKLNHNTGKYSIGIKLFEVGVSYQENTDLYDEVRKIVRYISRESNEAVHLAVLDGTEVIYLMKEEGTHTIRMASSIGRRLPAHATAVGKALLSGLSDDEIRDLYQDIHLVKVTSHTISEVEKLIEQLRQTRVRGYASEQEESTENITCVAAPIRNSTGSVCAAVSISVPVFRIEEENMKYYTKLIVEGARKIESLIQSLNRITLF